LTAGLVGVASFLFVDLGALIMAIPVAAGEDPPVLLKIATFIQTAVLTTLAVIVGIWLSPKVGLHAPAAEAASRGEAFLPKLMPQILSCLRRTPV
jgi:hypothetical protein